MNILVTGGAGFIGSHLVDYLHKAGHKIFILDNFITGSLNNIPLNHPDVILINGDICDKGLVFEATEGMDYIFHLAACVSVQKSIEDPEFSKRTNIDGFFNVLEAARIHKVKKIIFTSSAAIYGNPQHFPICENHEKAPLSPYGAEKLIGEEYLKTYFKAYGLPYVSARLFNVFGPRQDPYSPYSGVISIFEGKAKQKKPLMIYGDGSQSRDFIPVFTVAQSLMHLGLGQAMGEFNLGTAIETDLNQLAKTILRKYNLNPDEYLKYEQKREGDIWRSIANTKKLTEILSDIMKQNSDNFNDIYNSVTF